MEVHFFFYLMSNYTVENAYINDVNKELMLVYNVIKKDPKNLIDELCILNDKYILKNRMILKKNIIMILDLYLIVH